MNKDFLKFFDLSFKKFLTRTSILVAVISFNSSFATDAPSPTPNDGPTVSSPNRNRRGSAFGRGFNAPPKKLETEAKELIGEIASPTAGHHRRSSGATMPPASSDSSTNPPNLLPPGGASEEIASRMPKSPSILSFPSFTKKEEVTPPSTPADNSGPASVGTIESPNRKSIGGSSTLVAESPRRESNGASSTASVEKKPKKQPPKELTPEQKAEEERAGKMAEERAKKILAAHQNLKKSPEDTNLGQLRLDISSTGGEFSTITHGEASKSLGTNKHPASPRHGKKHDKELWSTTSSTTTAPSVSDPVSVTITNPPVDLPESTTDVGTSSFYLTPKSRHTGSTTLVRRISSVIGDHLFTRSLSQAAAAGDAGSEPVKFGFWGSANSDNTTNSDPGSKKKTTTFSQTLGFDADLGDVLVGGAISASKGRLGYKDGDNEGDKIKTNTKVFTLYNTVDLRWGLFSKTFVSYGSTRLHSYVDDASSEAKYKQKMWSGQTELGYNYKAGTLNYVVSGGVRYIHTDTPEHKEYSDGSLSQIVKKDTADDFEFIGSVGVNKLIKRDGYDIIPHVTFSARKRFAGQSPGTVYVREDSLAEYSVSGQSDKKFYSQVALGSQVKYKSAILQVAAHYGFAKKYSNIGGTMMLRFEM